MTKATTTEPLAVYDGRLLLGLVHQAGGQWRAVTAAGRDLGLFTSARAASNALLEVHAPASTAFPVRLGERLRLVDDPLQWIVERQGRKPTATRSGWQQIRFHRDRDALLVWMRTAGAEPEAIATVSVFPRWHR
jgi:hypothetical protein